MMPETKWIPTWKDEQTTCSRKPSVAPKGQKVRYIDQFRQNKLTGNNQVRSLKWKWRVTQKDGSAKWSRFHGGPAMSAGTVLHYRLSMCTKGFPFVQEFAFLTWNLCISYKDTLYELDKCFLQVLVIPECALLELQHCRPSNWPGFAPKQRPLPLPLVPASSQLFFLIGYIDLHYKAVLVGLLVCYRHGTLPLFTI